MSKDRMTQLQEYWELARSEHKDWRERAQQSFKFYRGEQWSPEDKELLRKSKRPALTFNKIKPVIRNISGFQRQNRQDLEVLSRRGGASILAEVFTELLKYFYDISLADWKVSHQFLNGIISGKGWLALDIDYTKEPISGDLLLQVENPLMIYEDPFSQRYDLSDAKFIIRTSWSDQEEIIKKFPKSKKDIESLAQMPLEERTKISLETQDYDLEHEQEQTEIHKYRFLVKEYWHRDYVEKKLLVNRNTLEITETEESKEKIEKIIKMREGYGENIFFIERVLPVLNLTTTVGDVELQNIEDPFNGVSSFPLVRFCSEMLFGDKTHVRGEIDDLIDPQNEINKRRSQALHNLNTTANSGYIISEGAMSHKEQARLEKLGSSPGIVTRANKGFGLGQGIWRIDPSVLSQGHIKLSELADNELKEISGARDMLGYSPDREESGIALQLRRQHGLITTEPLFDNFEWTQRILGETILEFVRKTDILGDEEIVNIIQERHLRDNKGPQDPMQRQMQQEMKEEQLLGALKSKSIGKYQLVMSTRRNTPTQRMLDFQQMMEAVRMGVPIPPELLIEASDLPNKQEIIDNIKQQQAAQQGAPGVPGVQGVQRPPGASPAQVGPGMSPRMGVAPPSGGI